MGKCRNNFIISDTYCTECGNKGITIPRKVGSQREAGHLKKLFCLHCQKETNHAEIRPFGAYNLEDFMEEFTLGRFVDGKKIPVSELSSCKKINCEYNKSGKCWNSNHSYACPHRAEDETQHLLKKGW